MIKFILLLLILQGAFVLAKDIHVVIDPGHGGKDPGACWYGVKEADLNLKVAKKVSSILKEKGVKCTLTRSGNRFLTLQERADVANKTKNAVFVSIHFNASTLKYVKGIETFFASPQGAKIAKSVHDELVKRLKRRDRRIRKAPQLAVLNKTKCPAILVECGYISNKYEGQLCKSDWYQSLAARAIVEGILRYK